jgi:spermidine/putrescine transport system substrate-binding protein
MSIKNHADKSATKIGKKQNLSRRSVLQGAVAVGAVLAAPAIISRRALASSGELNVLMWSDYLPPEFLEGFKKETGITINHTGIGSNEEIINKMKATKGRGFDLVSPTNMRSPQWIDLGLLQPFDSAKVNTSTLNPAMVAVGETEWNFEGKGVHWLPQLWGTEALGWRTDLWQPEGGVPSYGDIWSPEMKGKTMGRPHSMMLGAGLYLETTGDLAPGSMRKAYDSEEVMRPIWEKVTKFCIDNKEQVKLFWDDADSQKNGLLNDGVVIGQTWDGPILAMKSAGEPVTYQAPKEGALAWVDGISMPIGAENIDEIYAFLNYSFKPENGGLTADKTGYNSAVLGADQHISDVAKKNFSEAYPGDALTNLFPWPKEPQWYADVRTEYRNKFVNA